MRCDHEKYGYKLSNEIDSFKKAINVDLPNSVKYNNGLSAFELFNITSNKRVLIINLFANLIKSHYESGKVKAWYDKYSQYTIIPSFNSISSLETPYPFGNGVNEHVNTNFFETFDNIKR